LQKRLFFSTVFLISLVVISLAELSNWMVGDLIAKRQSEFEMNSFQQAGRRVQNVFQSSEGTLDLLVRTPGLRGVLVDPFDRSDSVQTVQFTNAIEVTLHSLMINRRTLDSVIFLGRNGFSCVYTQKDILFDTRLLDPLPPLSVMAKAPFLAGILKLSKTPWYYRKPATGPSGAVPEGGQLASLMDQKILLSREVTSPQGGLDGVILVLVRNDLLATIIPSSPYSRSLSLTLASGEVVWSSRQGEGSEVGDVLVTESALGPTDFRVVSRTSVHSYFKQDSFLALVSLSFALGAIVLAFLSSWFFSRHSTRQLDALAKSLSNGETELPERLEILPESSWEYRTTLRGRLYIHFGVSLVAPLILFGSLLTFLDLQVYREKIWELTRSSGTQLKWTVEDVISSWDRISLQTVFDDALQGYLEKAPGTPHDPVQTQAILDAFLTALRGDRNLISFHLFDPQGRPLLSTLPASTLVLADHPGVFSTILESSSGQFEFLGLDRNFQGLGSTLLFARKISDKGLRFGSLLGYLVMTADKEAVLERARGLSSSDVGRFDLVDASEPGVQTLPVTFADPLLTGSLQLVGAIPEEAVTGKVWPLLVGESGVLLFAIFLCLAASLLISRSLARPLRVLEGLMEEIRRERFDVRMHYNGRDEVTVLAHSFNRMVDRLNQLVHENYRSKVEQGELRLLEKEAQLNVLQQQINPHFLYNTLDSIQWMAYRAGAMDISRMVTALGRFFRGVAHTEKGLVTVGEELEFLENYLSIQKIRYQEKLTVRVEVPSQLKQAMTLKLFLQPLVENALIYGVEPLKTGGKIEILAEQRGEEIIFRVRDNGMGMAAHRLSQVRQTLADPSATGASIGLANVAKRLRLHFDEASLVTIESIPLQGTEVCIVHPLNLL